MNTPTNQPIFVGVDGSGPSMAALEWAAREAAIQSRDLVIVHAAFYCSELTLLSAPGAQAENPGLAETPAETPLDERLYGGDLAEHCLKIAADLAPAITVTAEVHEGDAVSYLVACSRSAAMIVMGSHGNSSIVGAVLASISQLVAAHAHCPVVVITPRPDDKAVRRNYVVVGVSPSAAGEQALRFAFEQAQSKGLALVAVRCWGDVAWIGSGSGMQGSLLSDWKGLEQRVLDNCVDELAEEFPTVRVEKRLPQGRPQWSLQHASHGADLLVVGCHRPDDHWLSRLGPVASWLLHRAPCPMAVVGADHEIVESDQPS
jgi:nucleotide-binding universal stress UspA family protein